MDERTSEITQVLADIDSGDAGAAGRLMSLVYDELQRIAASQMARQPAGQTLQATALVHEAYLRLLGGGPVSFENRGAFYAAATRAMRNILVDQARRKGRLKRGGDLKRRPLAEDATAAPETEVDLVALHESLDRLEGFDPRKAQVIMHRYFGGLTIEETANVLGIAPATVERDWEFARTWLHRDLRDDERTRG